MTMIVFAITLIFFILHKKSEQKIGATNIQLRQ